MKALVAMIAYVFGIIIVPVLNILTPAGAKQWRFLDSIYGNKVDGLDGDASYQNEVPNTFMRRYRWCQLRNPINNLLRSYGPSGYIRCYHEVETHRKKYREIILHDGSVYSFTQIRIFGEWHFWYGHRIMAEHKLDMYLKEDTYFENTMILWPIKNKRV